MKEHYYKGFVLIKSGYSKTPWNIYNQNYVWLGWGYTLKGCKIDIDNGCFDEDINRKY